MSKEVGITEKRQILADFRLRFAPEVQQTRENLIDSYIQRILVSSEETKGMTAKDIQDSLHDIFMTNVGIQEILSSLTRSIQEEKVKPLERVERGIKEKGPKNKAYTLNVKTKEELEKVAIDATERFTKVCERLFREAGAGWSAYSEPFFKFLCLVFSRLAGDNYRMVRNELPSHELASTHAYTSALKAVRSDLKNLDTDLFDKSAEKFFRHTDPDYALIKWNMAQNYYVLRMIGLGNRLSMLTEEAFEKAEFYMDTNVVISALDPHETYHKAFISLCKVCNKKGIKVKVFRETIDELERVIVSSRENLFKVIEQIPEETKYKISSNFYEIYIEKTSGGEEVDMDQIFHTFESADEKLRDNFNISLEEDEWFNQVRSSESIQEYANTLADRFKKMSTRRKGDLAAIHDALCLTRIEERRNSDGQNIWFITRDHTLPGCVPPSSAHESLAITLDALIQWLAPMVEETNQVDVALAYSEILGWRVLPQERIFNLEDFVIFNELEMECKELPAEDVEGCIRYLKQHAPLLNPTIATDREKLARHIAVYFADPSRKYKSEKEKYETEISSLKGLIEEETQKSIRKGALLRISILAIGLILLEIIAVLLTGFFGSGENFFQKVSNHWGFLSIPFGICIMVGWFYLGRKGIRALGWPMTKIFKEE